MTLQGHLDLRDAPRDQRGILLPDASEFGQAMDETIAQVMQTLTAPEGEPSAPAPAAAPAPTLPPLDRAFARLGIGPDRAQRLLAVAVLCVAGAAVLSLLTVLRQDAPATPATASAAPTAAPAPTATPAPTAAPPIPAFWGPGGAPIDTTTIDPSAIERVTARYGDTWVSVRLVGGGTVWIAAGTLPPGISTADLVDMAAAPTPTPAPAVPPRATDPPQPPPVCSDHFQAVLNGAPIAEARICGATEQEVIDKGTAWAQGVIAAELERRRAAAPTSTYGPDYVVPCAWAGASPACAATATAEAKH